MNTPVAVRWVVVALVAVVGSLIMTARPSDAQGSSPGPFSQPHYATVTPTQQVLFGQPPSAKTTATPPPSPFLTPDPSALARAKGQTAPPTSQPETATPGPQQATTPLSAEADFPVTDLDQQIGWFGSDQAVEPPDTQLAAGPNYLLETLNDSMSVWSKSGGLVGKTDFYAFFHVPVGSSFTDPRVVFDASSGRFFASGLVIARNASGVVMGSTVYVAVSATSDPTGAWTIYAVASNTSGIINDQPKLGVNDDKITLGWNDFSGATWTGSELWVIDKAQALSGGSAAEASFVSTTQFGPAPVISLSSTSTEYVAINDASSYLPGLASPPSAALVAITGTPSASDVSLSTASVPIAETSPPPAADQPSNPASVATNDDRFLAAVWRNGDLWVSNNEACIPSGDNTARPCMRLTEIATATPSLLYQTNVGNPGQDLYYPAVTTDSAGDLFVTYSLSSSATYPSADLFGLAVGASAFQGLTIQAGQNPYLPTECGFSGSRWGDYSGAAVDPSNPADVWMTGEYVAASSNNCDWGTATAEATFSAPPPPTPAYEVGAEGGDGALWVRSDLTSWSSLGGGIIAAPAIAALPQTSGPPLPLFIVTGTNHTLWERTASTNWTMLGPADTYCTDNPAAVVTGSAPGTLTVACEGGDGTLYTATMSVPSSGLPDFGSWTALGGALGAGPAVAPVNGVITYFVTAGFNNGQVWTRTATTGWAPTNFYCAGHPAAGTALGGTTTWFGCEAGGELWAGPVSGGVAAQGGAIAPGPGLGITSTSDYMFAEADFGGDSVWMRTTTASWSDLGGSVLNGVGAVGLR